MSHQIWTKEKVFKLVGAIQLPDGTFQATRYDKISSLESKKLIDFFASLERIGQLRKKYNIKAFVHSKKWTKEEIHKLLNVKYIEDNGYQAQVSDIEAVKILNNRIKKETIAKLRSKFNIIGSERKLWTKEEFLKLCSAENKDDIWKSTISDDCVAQKINVGIGKIKSLRKKFDIEAAFPRNSPMRKWTKEDVIKLTYATMHNNNLKSTKTDVELAKEHKLSISTIKKLRHRFHIFAKRARKYSETDIFNFFEVVKIGQNNYATLTDKQVSQKYKIPISTTSGLRRRFGILPKSKASNKIDGENLKKYN